MKNPFRINKINYLLVCILEFNLPGQLAPPSTPYFKGIIVKWYKLTLNSPFLGIKVYEFVNAHGYQWLICILKYSLNYSCSKLNIT